MGLAENILFDHRYLLLRMLGRGGSSEVWLADDQRSGMQVAIKVYAPGIGLDDDGIQLFREEFKLVFRLNNPNLLRPTHYEVCDRMPYFVMPYMEKGSTMSQTGDFTEEQAWRFLRDVASGLEYLHGRNVIHQDIKPDNILVDDDGDFLITDFGISMKMRTTLDAFSDKSGDMTMAYAAPERWSKKNRPVRASDIWALGVSVFELLTGNPPYGELGGRLQYEGAPIPEMEGSWSGELNTIVRRCLQRDIKDRPTAGEIVKVCKSVFEKKGQTRSTFTPPVREPNFRSDYRSRERGYVPRPSQIPQPKDPDPGPDKITYLIILAGVVLMLVGGLLLNSKKEPPPVDPPVKPAPTIQVATIAAVVDTTPVVEEKPMSGSSDMISEKFEYFIAAYNKRTGVFKFTIIKYVPEEELTTVAGYMAAFIETKRPGSGVNAAMVLMNNGHWGSGHSGQTGEFIPGNTLTYKSK